MSPPRLDADRFAHQGTTDEPSRSPRRLRYSGFLCKTVILSCTPISLELLLYATRMR
jgi:hypothetical protein